MDDIKLLKVDDIMCGSKPPTLIISLIDMPFLAKFSSLNHTKLLTNATNVGVATFSLPIA